MGPRLSGLLSACGVPCAITGVAAPVATNASSPSGATDERNQRLMVKRSWDLAWIGARTRYGTKWPSVSKRDIKLKLDGEVLTPQRGCHCLLPSPQGQMHQLLLRHRSTPPDAFAHDHDRQQVSWLTGYRLRPPSQRILVSSGIYGRWLSAYSCGGSRGFAHRCARTAFPWLALAGTTGHKRGIGSCCESIAESASMPGCRPC